MKYFNLTIKIIRMKKEVYYPLFSILGTFLIYWLFVLVLNFLNSQIVFPFVISILSIILFTYSLDVHHLIENNSNPTLKKLNFALLTVSITIMSSMVIWLIVLIIIEIYYIIPIIIHIIISILIYYILKREVIKYYNMKAQYINKA